jgi:hypothetical protein
MKGRGVVNRQGSLSPEQISSESDGDMGEIMNNDDDSNDYSD